MVIAVLAAEWLASVESFQEWEIRLEENGVPCPSKNPEHKTILTALIANGTEFLEALTSRQDIPALGFTLDDFRATLQNLKQNFRAEYAPEVSPQMRREIRAAFGICEP